MYDERPVVDVWVGTFASEAALENYLEETYPDGEEERSISKLAADMGHWYYDHDLIEHTWHPPGSTDITACLDGHSWSQSYATALAAAYRAIGSPPFSVLLLSFEEAIDHPVSVIHEDYQLHYLGQFPVDRKASSYASME